MKIVDVNMDARVRFLFIKVGAHFAEMKFLVMLLRLLEGICAVP